MEILDRIKAGTQYRSLMLEVRKAEEPEDEVYMI